MAYLGAPFKHDVFISYSRGDARKVGSTRLQQWSFGFKLELEAELQFARGFETTDVFIDQERDSDGPLDLMAPLDAELKAKVEASALMAVLLSPHYLDSEWGRLEREWWREAQHQQQLTSERNVAIVRILPLEPTRGKLPPPLADAAGVTPVGFWFYDRRKTEEPRPFEWPCPSSKSTAEFREALLQLTGQLRNRLLELKERLTERRRALDEASRLTADQPTIYLHGNDSDAARWDAAAQELGSATFTVVPLAAESVQTDPTRAQRASQNRVQLMGSCDALLLVATPNEAVLVADLLAIGRQDRLLARATSNRLLPGAVLNIGGTISDPTKLRSLAEKLQLDWLELPASGWGGQVRTWLAGKSRTP